MPLHPTVRSFANFQTIDSYWGFDVFVGGPGGAAIQNIPNFFFFAVLEHPMDVYGGKPRGCNEIASKLQNLGLPHEESKITVVSDTWKGTIAGIKKYRNESGVSATDFPHKLVNPGRDRQRQLIMSKCVNSIAICVDAMMNIDTPIARNRIRSTNIKTHVCLQRK